MLADLRSAVQTSPNLEKRAGVRNKNHSAHPFVTRMREWNHDVLYLLPRPGEPLLTRGTGSHVYDPIAKKLNRSAPGLLVFSTRRHTLEEAEAALDLTPQPLVNLEPRPSSLDISDPSLALPPSAAPLCADNIFCPSWGSGRFQGGRGNDGSHESTSPPPVTIPTGVAASNPRMHAILASSEGSADHVGGGPHRVNSSSLFCGDDWVDDDAVGLGTDASSVGSAGVAADANFSPRGQARMWRKRRRRVINDISSMLRSSPSPTCHNAALGWAPAAALGVPDICGAMSDLNFR